MSNPVTIKQILVILECKVKYQEEKGEYIDFKKD